MNARDRRSKTISAQEILLSSAASIDAERSVLEYAVSRIEMEAGTLSALLTNQQSQADSIETGHGQAHVIGPGWPTLVPGLLLVALAGVALYAGSDLAGRRGFALGPGTMPGILSFTLLGLAILVVVEGFFRGRIHLPASAMPFLVISAAGAVFLLAVSYVGLAIATGLASAIVASYGLRGRYIAFALVVVASLAVSALLEAARR